MIHTDEQRVGEDRDLHEVIFEAIDFISQLSRDGLIKDNETMRRRVAQAVEEVRLKSIQVPVEGSKLPRVIGGNWTQTTEELEHGIRLSWKHARKCIMRSEYSSLRLYDLRHVTTSKEMGHVLIDKMTEAYNGGDIHPSAFVFPAKEPTKPGPMVWNTQLLAFAGYTQPDKSVLGDPGNVSITESILSLGWQPPAIRTRWDLLPLVTVADGDEPYITPIPPNSFPPVSIRHPNPDYSLGFDKLGLRWVPAPALSRLGFDIGGVQYTAVPFLGWFMDAEIGVRDLADSFRYNSLPAVSSALRLLKSGQSIDDLPQAERLLHLSRSQAELNYAVHWSFQQAGVRMSDTLSASSMYLNFDDNHLATYGFRLPADPYWLSPPQGSIVPAWHRGGAPNYQPKPMICRLKANPAAIWRGKHGSNGVASLSPGNDKHAKKGQSAAIARNNVGQAGQPRWLRIFYCSSGSTAERLAKRLAETLAPKFQARGHDDGEKPTTIGVEALNDLNWNAIEPGSLILVIASSTGRGDVPTNGASMLRDCESRDPGQLKDFSFAIFGNGNASYGSSFNGAAIKLQSTMEKTGCKSALPLLKGDTSKENPPWRQLDDWVKQLTKILDGNSNTADTTSGQDSQSDASAANDHEITDLASQFAVARLVSTESFGSERIQRVVLDVGKLYYTPMWHADIIVPLWGHEIDELLDVFGLTGRETCVLNGQKWTSRQLLSLVDTEKPFKSLSWTESMGTDASTEELREIRDCSIKEAVIKLRPAEHLKPSLSSLAQDLPTRGPRTFSIASSQHYRVSNGQPSYLELLVETHTGGLFTDKFLSGAESRQELYVRLRAGPGECLLGTTSPLIAFTTGSGIAPLRGLLQHKSFVRSREMRIMEDNLRKKSSFINQNFAIFAGFKAEDSEIIKDCVQEAACAGRLGFLALTPSNVMKERVQDTLFEKNCSKFIRNAILEQGACVFACAARPAVDDFARNLEAIIGVNSIRDILRDRWIEEVFEPAN
ncbi:hypothetical protein QQS21_007867 [Conoideocrella luteorostrata]|uniref:nitric-oxide synthase (NADPH) n=1 Tax=Conoideocrella luteorostrata TaxID=1105319 RepID=A0AAJ0CJW6_9HYPO|nr:hypothetical protein QQS21_007867 [Conoideocrella luteorostrata]